MLNPRKGRTEGSTSKHLFLFQVYGEYFAAYPP
jgi:hypothetical protein